MIWPSYGKKKKKICFKKEFEIVKSFQQDVRNSSGDGDGSGCEEGYYTFTSLRTNNKP